MFPLTRSGRTCAIALALFAACLALFARAVDNGFINMDDPEYVTNNPHVLGGLSRPNLIWAFTTFETGNWHPLTWISLQLDASIFGVKPWGFHLTNVVLHAASASILFLALCRMTGDSAASVVAAALFAAHPLRVESVAWIAERKDVLSGLFWMLTLTAYAEYVRRPSWRLYVPVLLGMALGLLAKPMLVTLPFVLLLLDYWPLGRAGAKNGLSLPVLGWLCVEKTPLFLLAGATCAVTVVAQSEVHALATLVNIPLPERLANAALSYATYLGQMCYPAGLAPMYPHPADTVSAWRVALALVFLVAITVVVVRCARRRCLIVGWLWYLGTLVPVIGLVQVGSQAHADRYTYIPQLGIILAGAWAAADWARTRHWEGAASSSAALLLSVSCVLTWTQIAYWHDNIRLWEHTVAVTVDNGFARDALGKSYLEAGRLPEACPQIQLAVQINPYDGMFQADLGQCLLRQRRIPEALGAYRRAFELMPGRAVDHTNCGYVLEVSGAEREATEEYRKAVDLGPHDPLSRVNLARMLLREGKADEAVKWCLEAIGLDPGLAQARHGLGEAQQALGNGSAALESYARAVELLPDQAAFRVSFAQALEKQGKSAAAEEQYREIYRRCPEWVEDRRRMVWTLAAHPSGQHRNGALAVTLATLLCRIAGDKPQFLDALAASFADVGQFADAQTTAKRALDLAVAGGRNDLARELRARLQLYERNQPYRQATVR